MATAVMMVPFELKTEHSPRESGVPTQILKEVMKHLPKDCVIVGMDTNMDQLTFDFKLYSSNFEPDTKLVAKFKTMYTENLPGLFDTIQVFDKVEKID